MRILMACTISIALTLASQSWAQTQDSVERDILEAINKVARERGIPTEQAMKKTADLLVNGQYFSKGGVGVIRDHAYAVTDSKVNEVIVAGVKTTGASFKTTELFVLCKGKMVGSIRLPVDGEDDLALVLFTPQKIRLFDWKTTSGGYYLRGTE